MEKIENNSDERADGRSGRSGAVSGGSVTIIGSNVASPGGGVNNSGVIVSSPGGNSGVININAGGSQQVDASHPGAREVSGWSGIIMYLWGKVLKFFAGKL